MYENNFNRWKLSFEKTRANETVAETPQLNTTNDYIHSGQIISQDIFSCTETEDNAKQFETDSDSRMSPLIYECSESENDENDSTLTKTQTQTQDGQWLSQLSDSDIEIPNGQTRFRQISASSSPSSSQSSDKMISPRMTRTRAKNLLESSTVLTRSKQKARPTAAKGRHYKQLNVETKDMSRKNKKDKEQGSKPAKNNRTGASSTNAKKQSAPFRSTRYSDVELMSQKLSPIYVPNSSESIFRLRHWGNTKTNPPIQNTKKLVDSNAFQLTPDIFASIDDSQALPNAGHDTNGSQLSTIFDVSTPSSPANKELNHRRSISLFSDSTHSIETNAIRLPDLNGSKSFNTTSDIFEITKNNVFHNVLQVRSDQKVSPFRRRPSETDNKMSPNKFKSCFDGFRVVIPKLKTPIETPYQSNKSTYRKTPAPNPDRTLSARIIDITESQSERVPSKLPTRRSLEHAFDKVGRPKSAENGVEKTPPRREAPTTPTTRSCLKRAHGKERALGWLSKKKSPREQSANNETVTPKSCRRLDMSFASTSKCAYHANAGPFKPRTLFDRMRGGRRITRSQSVSVRDEPIIVFSSDEEC